MTTIIVFALGYIVGGGTALVLLSFTLAAQRGDRALRGTATAGRRKKTAHRTPSAVRNRWL